MTIHIISLKFDIMFDDADDGPCWAGEGSRLVKVVNDEETALDFCKKLNPIIEKAEKETIIIPRQPYNIILKEELGFYLHDLEQGNENYKLCVDSYEVEDR